DTRPAAVRARHSAVRSASSSSRSARGKVARRTAKASRGKEGEDGVIGFYFVEMKDNLPPDFAIRPSFPLQGCSWGAERQTPAQWTGVDHRLAECTAEDSNLQPTD